MSSLHQPEIDARTALRLNDEIANVLSAQIPLELDPGSIATQKQMEHMNADIALQVARGTSVDQAIESQSPAYRTTLQAFSLSQHSLASLEILFQFGKNQTLQLRKSRYARNQLLTLYFMGGLLYFLWLPSYTDIVKSLYGVSGVQTGPALQTLLFLKHHYFESLGIFGLLLALLYFLPGLFLLKPLSKAPVETSKDKQIAESAIAKMLNDLQIGQRCEVSTQTISSLAANTTYPLLEWAQNQTTVSATEPATPLRLVQEINDARLAIDEKKSRGHFNFFDYVVPGAFLVFGLGFLLFWPFIELLITISLP